MELEIEPDPEFAKRLRHQSDTILHELESETFPLLERYPQAPAIEQELIRKQALTYHLKKKYLLRIRESLNKFATRS
jgi:molecular chaperone HscB